MGGPQVSPSHFVYPLQSPPLSTQQIDLPSLWDSLLSLRLCTLPRICTCLISLPSVERRLRGAMHDSHLRRVFGKAFMEAPICLTKRTIGSHSSPVELFVWFDNVSTLPQTIMAIIELWLRTGTTMDPMDDTTICPNASANPIYQLDCDLL
ncbi:hypothetical protein JAAARDRAFT_39979 [Jaapia argillacea MUCL 33604]|uniref:Uncharacterized protein n=1 Tax=Jaapia argillacea MUCL 33604 TaxID=933084 RepID=A0A067PD44_9AGAM|nr:hypothetical protein JAAARDRAFT_39979 [Jaapia argillacea MUCL 33604]